MDLRPLADDVLLRRLELLVRQERENVADIVEHLAEVDRRELAIDRGHTALFEYCTKKLGYSEAAAFLRIRAARACAAFPRVLADLRSGAVHLDTIMRLYPHLNGQNCDSLLEKAAGLPKRKVLELTAQLGGVEKPAERDVIRPLPTPSCPEAASPEKPAAPPVVSPCVIAAPRLRLSFTASDGFVRDFERLRGLLRHRFPEGRLEDVLQAAVSALLERLDPGRRTRGPRTPSPGQPKNRWRRIPTGIKAEVWKRDCGRCAYVAADGRRCEATEGLEYDHIVPFALGGPSDEVSNIRLLCRPHNQRLGRRQFGPRRRA